jgi:hypothetical protein
MSVLAAGATCPGNVGGGPATMRVMTSEAGVSGDERNGCVPRRSSWMMTPRDHLDETSSTGRLKGVKSVVGFVGVGMKERLK